MMIVLQGNIPDTAMTPGVGGIICLMVAAISAVGLLCCLWLHSAKAWSHFAELQVGLLVIPSSFLVVAAAYYNYVVIRLGHLSRPGSPDPNTVGASLLSFHIAWLAYGSIFLAAALWGVPRVLVLLGTAKRRMWGIILCLMLWIGFYQMTTQDPLYFFRWLAD